MSDPILTSVPQPAIVKPVTDFLIGMRTLYEGNIEIGYNLEYSSRSSGSKAQKMPVMFAFRADFIMHQRVLVLKTGVLVAPHGYKFEDYAAKNESWSLTALDKRTLIDLDTETDVEGLYKATLLTIEAWKRESEQALVFAAEYEDHKNNRIAVVNAEMEAKNLERAREPEQQKFFAVALHANDDK